jgi:hypothetical protein
MIVFVHTYEADTYPPLSAQTICGLDLPCNVHVPSNHLEVSVRFVPVAPLFVKSRFPEYTFTVVKDKQPQR